MGRKYNRCSKKQRQERREIHAATWAEGFEHGYQMGYEQGQKDNKIPMFSDVELHWIKTGELISKPIDNEERKNFFKEWHEAIKKQYENI